MGETSDMIYLGDGEIILVRHWIYEEKGEYNSELSRRVCLYIKSKGFLISLAV